jgi:hypothetical protein
VRNKKTASDPEKISYKEQDEQYSPVEGMFAFPLKPITTGPRQNPASESAHVNISECSSPHVPTLLRKRTYIVASVLVAAAVLAPIAVARRKAPSGYFLAWSDEFNTRNGSLPDASKWTYDIGGSGWGNHELEYYTNRAENARIEHGKLVITARAECIADRTARNSDTHPRR